MFDELTLDQLQYVLELLKMGLILASSYTVALDIPFLLQLLGRHKLLFCRLVLVRSMLIFLVLKLVPLGHCLLVQVGGDLEDLGDFGEIGREFLD